MKSSRRSGKARRIEPTRPDAGAAVRSVRDLLAAGEIALTPSESKIVQVLLADYPRAGLGSASALARRAAVSDPTVVRLANKLGFSSFSDFQGHLLEDVEARLRSPLMMMERRAARDTSVVADYMMSVAQRITEAADAAVIDAYSRAADLILQARGSVKLVGGRFSRHVAAMLAGYLTQFRSGVGTISPISAESIDELLDLGPRDVLIAFDYRRYQTDVINLVRQASARNVRILLFTDPWLSPLADVAEIVFIAPSEVNSPYDTLAPAVAQMEALVAQLVAREPTVMERRVQQLETLRHSNAVTLDSDQRSSSPKSRQKR